MKNVASKLIRRFNVTARDPPSKGKLSSRLAIVEKMELGSTVVEMKGITKRFPGVLANDNINFDVKAGEIHALLGENGAGKTTLMKILYGLYGKDSGEIYLRGQKVDIRSPREAISLGIGMVHQHFMLISELTVIENIILGLEPLKGAVLDFETAEKKIVEAMKRHGFKVDLKAKIWELSVGIQQRVEILKALYRDVNILILDEPTAVLSPTEVRELFKALRGMAEEGYAIIFITHKLREVMDISNRVTVLRKGKVIATVETSKTNMRELAKMMVGRDVIFQIKRAPVKSDEVILEVKDLQALDDRGMLALKGVSFTIHRGEILGLAGVSGNGQSELEEVLVNLRRAKAGKVLLRGREISNKSPRDVIEQGVAYIPEDRLGKGVITDFPITKNVILKTHSDEPFSRKGFLNDGEIDRHSERLVSKYDVMTPSIKTYVRYLSGGNIQKLILAREMESTPNLLIAAQPTRGLDVGATEYIRNMLIQQKENGTAILLISEDLDEILSLSDRIAVIYEGEIMGIIPTEKVNIEELGLMMAGVKPKSAG